MAADDDHWLYVSSFVPLENARHAGGRVAFENLRNLRLQHAAVDAVVCTTESEAVAPAPPGVRVFRQHGRDLAAYLILHARSLGVQRLLTASVMHTRLQIGAQGEIERRMRQNRYAGLFADFTQSVLLVQRSASATGCTAPMTACIHDVIAQRLLRSTSRRERWLTGAVLRDEHTLLCAAQRVLTLSEKDSQLARSLYTLANVETKPFDPPKWCTRVRRSTDDIDSSVLLFFANFERHENSGAARWFARTAFSTIRGIHQDATLTLAGTGSDALAAELACPGISGTGYLEDPSPLFSRCALVIAPLFQGAGVKFKVLEALAAGVPVLGTPIALEGVDPQPGLMSAPAERFAAKVIDFLSTGKAG